MSVVLFTDLSGKELYRQVGVGRILTSRSLDGVMFSTRAWNARDMGSIPALSAIFPFS